VLLFILSHCGFSGALATRILDPLITSIAADSLPRSASSGIEAAELIALPLLASGSGPARSRCDP
jgi:hypothetical protein